MPQEAHEEGLRSALNELVRRPEVQVLDVSKRIQELKRCHENFRDHVQFKPGDIVKWKRPLKNKGRPLYDEPAIVVEVLEHPKIDPETETGSQYFGEPLDVILGIIGPDGDFIAYHYDHRRFELWEPAARRKAPKTGGASRHGS